MRNVTCQFRATLLRLRVERLGGRHGLRQLLRGRRPLLRVELELAAQLVPQALFVGLRSQKKRDGFIITATKTLVCMQFGR